MKWKVLNSSNLAACAYEHSTLYIQFKRGDIYQYTDCPESKYLKLLEIDERKKAKPAGIWSTGRYFNRNIVKFHTGEKL